MNNIIELDWTEFKGFLIQRNVLPHYFEIQNNYNIYAYDGPFSVWCLLPKLDPASSDQLDFENNYKLISNNKLGISSNTLNSQNRLEINASSTGIIGNPIPFSTNLTGGKDVSGNLQALKIDSNNALLVSQSGTWTTSSSHSAVFTTVVNSYITAISSVVTLLAANTNRKYAMISNTTGSQLNIQLGTSTGLSMTTGIVVAARSYFELKGDNLYTGPIFGAAAGASIITIIEGT